MTQSTWDAVDAYLSERLISPDPVLSAALVASDAAGLPKIQVAPNQGKLLHLVARMCGARRILEIGTLGGYSTIWLARALPPDGLLITLEYEPRHAAVAKDNVNRAGLSGVVEVRVGAALETLPGVEKDGIGPFDLIFIDADKPNIPEYFDWALRLSRVGSIVIVDNVVRDGEVADANSRDVSVQGVRRLMDRINSEPRVSATAVQTVGSKGYDGFAIALVTKVD